MPQIILNIKDDFFFVKHLVAKIQSVPYHIGLSPSFKAEIRTYNTRKTWYFLQENFYFSLIHFLK